MIGICYRYVENHQIAEDLAQDSFLTAVEKSSSYKGRGPFGAWLRTITINTALQHLRESRKKNLLEDYLLQNENQIKSENTLEEAKGALLIEGRMVFWTRTAWESKAAMRAYRDSAAHRTVMPRLVDWCDEASVAHWEGEPASDWDAIYKRMAAEGRLSRVRRPTAAHTAKTFSRLKRWVAEQVIPRSP